GVDVAMGEGLAMGEGVATGGVGPRTPSLESLPQAVHGPAMSTAVVHRAVVVRGDAFRPIRPIARDYQRPSDDGSRSVKTTRARSRGEPDRDSDAFRLLASGARPRSTPETRIGPCGEREHRR